MLKVLVVVAVLAGAAHADPASNRAVAAAVHAKLESPAFIDAAWKGVTGFKLAPFTPRITVDDATHVAWFTADVGFAGAIAMGYSPMDLTKGKWPARISGILADDHGWKVLATKVSFVAEDKDLTNTFSLIDYPPLSKDRDVQQIAAWFPGKLGAHRAASASPANVNGTSPADVARDDAALTKLVASWDKLRFTPRTVDITVLASGALLWADVVVTLPAAKGAVKQLRLGIIATPDAGVWKWVALNWDPDVDPAQRVH